MRAVANRRRFVAGLAGAGAALLAGSKPSLADEGPLETTTVRLLKESGICDAPLYVAEELLRADGFTDVRYVHIEDGNTDAGMIADGRLDFAQALAPEALRQMDAGKPLTVLAGVHPGCHELFAHEPINGITDLKGKRVAIPDEIGYGPRLMLALMATYVGLEPGKDFDWVTSATGDPITAFVEGKADAFFGGPVEAQELLARGMHRVIVKTVADRPWSQYFCCVLAGGTDYVRNYPMATKRVVRAVLKATDICLVEPRRAAQRLVDGGFIPPGGFILEALGKVPYGQWREYDPEDTLRFYALRLRELGFIKSSPKQLIAEGTNWRFLNELKRELKA